MKVEATLQLTVVYDTHGDEQFDPAAQLEHAGNALASMGQLTGDSAATVSTFSIAVATKELPEMDIDFLLAYGDGTWETKRHKVPITPAELYDSTGAMDLRALDPHIDRLLEEVYADADVVAMVPYWIDCLASGVDVSCGAPAPVDPEKVGVTSLTPIPEEKWRAQRRAKKGPHTPYCPCDVPDPRKCVCKGVCLCHFPPLKETRESNHNPKDGEECSMCGRTVPKVDGESALVEVSLYYGPGDDRNVTRSVYTDCARSWY